MCVGYSMVRLLAVAGIRAVTGGFVGVWIRAGAGSVCVRVRYGTVACCRSSSSTNITSKSRSRLVSSSSWRSTRVSFLFFFFFVFLFLPILLLWIVELFQPPLFIVIDCYHKTNNCDHPTRPFYVSIRLFIVSYRICFPLFTTFLFFFVLLLLLPSLL